MNSRLYIPALITLGLGLLSGCGGSSSSEQAYLPIGLQRTLDITLQDGKPYVFSFIIASESTATIYTGTSPAASTASLHVVNYKPASDSAEQIGFYWSSNDGETTSNLDALVVLYNPQNISKGIGSATCSVRDAEYTETETQQDNCQAVIRDFRVPPALINKPFLPTSLPAPMAGRDFLSIISSCRNRDGLSPRPPAKADMPERRQNREQPRSPITYLSTFPMGRQAEKATGMEERRTHPAREIPSSHKSCRISA